jgi:hypothetical protein
MRDMSCPSRALRGVKTENLGNKMLIREGHGGPPYTFTVRFLSKIKPRHIAVGFRGQTELEL